MHLTPQARSPSESQINYPVILYMGPARPASQINYPVVRYTGTSSTSWPRRTITTPRPTIVSLHEHIILNIMTSVGAQGSGRLLRSCRNFKHLGINPQFLCTFQSPIYRNPFQVVIERLIERSAPESRLPGLAWRTLNAVSVHMNQSVKAPNTRCHAHTVSLCQRRLSAGGLRHDRISSYLSEDHLRQLMTFLGAQDNANLQVTCSDFLFTSMTYPELWQRLYTLQSSYHFISQRPYQLLIQELIASPTLDRQAKNKAWNKLYVLRNKATLHRPQIYIKQAWVE